MKKNINFESALKRLEEIVGKMEDGGSELDKSLELNEEGIKLVKICSAKLDEAKKKVQILSKNGDKMKLENFKTAGDTEE